MKSKIKFKKSKNNKIMLLMLGLALINSSKYSNNLDLFNNIYKPIEVFANSDLLYIGVEEQKITSGVSYQKTERLYKSGWKDVHVVVVNMDNPNVALEILTSTTEHGLKKSVEDLTIENNAVVGINADFFGAGNPYSSMGQILEDGKVIESQNYYNFSASMYAGVFEDMFGNVFIDYLKSSQSVINNSNGSTISIQGINKYTDFSNPICFNTDAIQNTSNLDSNNDNLYKIIVSNNTIIQKAYPYEVVNVPQDGFIIVMNQANANNYFSLFNVGDNVSLNESYTFLFDSTKTISNISAGVSAGGEILRNGEHISTGLSISPNSNNPRSAVGVSQDGNKLILVAVDGRGDSVGATESEVASILLEYGAYNAIHLDGGGSTTLSIREEGSNNITTVNTPSDGIQRLVPNAIGIKSLNSSTGSLDSLQITIETGSSDTIYTDTSYDITIIGKDEFENPIAIDPNEITLSFKDYTTGSITGHSILPTKIGEHTLIATHSSGITAELLFRAGVTFSYLVPSAENTALSIGESTDLYLSTANTEGYFKALDFYSGEWTIDNPEIGYIQDNKFIATSNGLATLSVNYENLSATINIAVGSIITPIESFDTIRSMYTSYYPNDNTLSGGISLNNTHVAEGSQSLLLNYSFAGNKSTPQALYACFNNNPIAFPDKTELLQMQVKGDGSGNLLKAILVDSLGERHTITLVDSLDSTDWITASTIIPTDAIGLVSLLQIYVATLDTTQAEVGTIYIDNLEAISRNSAGGKVITSYNDPISDKLEETLPTMYEEDINVFGQTATKSYINSSTVLNDAINAMSKNSNALVFAGNTDLTGLTQANLDNIKNSNISIIEWNNTYNMTETEHLTIINLATKSGSMLTENPDQWRSLQDDLYYQTNNNILVNLDKNIWSDSNSLTGVRENELLHTILKDFTYETGKNVLVISATSDISTIDIKDGVRYLTLNGLSTNDPDNLNNYTYLKLRVNEDNFRYQLCDLY